MQWGLVFNFSQQQYLQRSGCSFLEWVPREAACGDSASSGVSTLDNECARGYILLRRGFGMSSLNLVTRVWSI